jgi:hypothetical protein
MDNKKLIEKCARAFGYQSYIPIDDETGLALASFIVPIIQKALLDVDDEGILTPDELSDIWKGTIEAHEETNDANSDIVWTVIEAMVNTAKAQHAITRERTRKEIFDFIETIEVPNLPSGHEDFIGYAAGKHDMRKSILAQLKGE